MNSTAETPSSGSPATSPDEGAPDDRGPGRYGLWIAVTAIALGLLLLLYDCWPMLRSRARDQQKVIELAQSTDGDWNRLRPELEARGLIIDTRGAVARFFPGTAYIFYRQPLIIKALRPVATHVLAIRSRMWTPFLCTVTWDTSGKVQHITGRGTILYVRPAPQSK